MQGPHRLAHGQNTSPRQAGYLSGECDVLVCRCFYLNLQFVVL